MHLRVFSFHAPLFFSFNYLMFLTAGNTTTTTAHPWNKSNCVTEIIVPLKFMCIQDCCPISITNCVTAHLVWPCLLSPCPSLLRDHLERMSPSIQRLVSSHGGTCPTEKTDEPSCFPVQHQQGPGLIVLLKILRPDGNSRLEKTLQNVCIHRTLLGKNKKVSLFMSLKPASALI